MRSIDVIKRFLMTEKSNVCKDDQNTYVFEVARDADKGLIQSSVEELYEVKVGSVRTLIQRGKYKRFGKATGRTKAWKKAYVTLTEGQIEVFEGV